MRTLFVVCDDHPGIVADVTEIIAATGANIDSFYARSVGTLSVISLSVSKEKHEECLHVLAASPYHGFSDDAILIQLEDKPGALAEISVRFRNADINLRSVRLIRRLEGTSIVAIGADRTDEIVELLKDVLIR